jgi:hypothetical protein
MGVNLTLRKEHTPLLMESSRRREGCRSRGKHCSGGFQRPRFGAFEREWRADHEVFGAAFLFGLQLMT